MAAAAEKPVGIFFWKVADGMSFWLGRTLFRVVKEGDEPPADPFDQKYRFPHPLLNFLKSPLWGQFGMWTMRILTALLMMHHGVAKFNDIDGFATTVVEPYFPFLPGSPQFWTVLAACIEVGGSFAIALGILVRPVPATAASNPLYTAGHQRDTMCSSPRAVVARHATPEAPRRGADGLSAGGHDGQRCLLPGRHQGPPELPLRPGGGRLVQL